VAVEPEAAPEGSTWVKLVPLAADQTGMGGSSYTPVEIRPMGTPPEDRSDLSMLTNSLEVEKIADILVQRAALDFRATPHGARGSARAQVAAYKLADAKVGHPWLLSREECLLLRDALLKASADDVIASGASGGGDTPDDGAVASWVNACRRWASFLDECSSLGGVSIDWLPERVETW
jgi:hypothetical protein